MPTSDLSVLAQDNLATLRSAAREREWNVLMPALTSLVQELGFFGALEIVIQRLQRHLPTFSQFHPNDEEPSGKLVRDLMVSIVAYGFAPERLPEDLPSQYTTPGSGQFVFAVLEMSRGMQPSRPAEERFSLLSSAIANGILAELTAYWYNLNPDAHQRVLSNVIDPTTNEYTDPDAARIPLQFWIDDGVAQRDIGAWLQTAYWIEKRLKQP
jgi:hypothetical protein